MKRRMEERKNGVLKRESWKGSEAIVWEARVEVESETIWRSWASRGDDGSRDGEEDDRNALMVRSKEGNTD